MRQVVDREEKIGIQGIQRFEPLEDRLP
jgi:hypothetical protein